jgi:hypothetical protein
MGVVLLGYSTEAEFCVSSSKVTSVTVRLALVNPLRLAGIATVRTQRQPALPLLAPCCWQACLDTSSPIDSSRVVAQPGKELTDKLAQGETVPTPEVAI